MEILATYLNQIIKVVFYLIIIILAVKLGISFAKNKKTKEINKD